MTKQGPGDEWPFADSPDSPDSSLGSRSDASRRDGRRAFRKAHRHPWLRRGSIVTASALAFLLVLGVGASFKLSSNIDRIDLTKALGKRPSSSASVDKVTNLMPLNILVMGSDSRDLGTTKYGTTPGGGSDTTLLVHLSADRKSAVVTSIPRDSMTKAPRDCKDPNSKVADGPLRMFNANFNAGGPACVIRTLEGNTDIRVDHFMVVDFVGFQAMVEALGSVEVCMPAAVNDKKSHLKLPAGRSQVSGEQALAFVRVRALGDGSDLGRIDRQQAFLSAMVQKATSSQLLLRPDRLFRFLLAATGSLTIDEGLTTNGMREMAQSVAGLKTSQVKFVTVPNEPWPQDHNRVQWTSAADALWTSIRTDSPLPGSKPAPGTKPRPKPTKTAVPVLTVTPDQVTVRVSNASGVNGRAGQAAADLRIQGFSVSGTSTDTDLLKKGVTVSYSGPNLEGARTVAAAFPGATLLKDDSLGADFVVTLGAGSPYVVEVPNRVGTVPLPVRTARSDPAPSSSVTIKARSADSNICGP